MVLWMPVGPKSRAPDRHFGLSFNVSITRPPNQSSLLNRGVRVLSTSVAFTQVHFGKHAYLSMMPECKTASSCKFCPTSTLIKSSARRPTVSWKRPPIASMKLGMARELHFYLDDG